MAFLFSRQTQVVIGMVTAAVARGATATSLTTSEMPKPIVKSGDTLALITPRGFTVYVTVTADAATAAKVISISSRTFVSGLPVGTLIYFEGTSYYNRIFNHKWFNVNQKIVFSAGTANVYDYLSNYSHPTQFNINSSASLADGDSKNNNWGARYGCFVAPCESKLVRVFGWINGNSISSSKPEAVTLSIWKKDSTANGTTATRITLLSQTLHQFPTSSANNYVEQIIDTPAVVAINKYDSVFVSIRRIGDEEHDRAATWYLDFEMIFEATDTH